MINFCTTLATDPASYLHKVGMSHQGWSVTLEMEGLRLSVAGLQYWDHLGQHWAHWLSSLSSVRRFIGL